MAETQYTIPWRDWIVAGRTKLIGVAAMLPTMLPGVPVFNVQSSSDYLSSDASSPSWWWGDFPMPLAPFELQWMEYSRNEDGYVQPLGVLAMRVDIDNPVHSLINTSTVNGNREAEMGLLRKSLETMTTDPEALALPKEEYDPLMDRLTRSIRVLEGVRWAQYLHLYLGIEGRAYCIGPLATAAVYINERGDTYGRSIVPEDAKTMLENVRGKLGGRLLEGIDLVKVMEHVGGMFGPCMMALSQLNTRNVEIVERSPDGKLSKAFSRRSNGHRLCTYKVLKVNSTLKIRPGVEDKLPSGAGVAEHRVRGHFAYYGDCAPDGVPRGKLFGKYTCRLWIESHIRGAVDHGVVVKDYEVTK